MIYVPQEENETQDILYLALAGSDMRYEIGPFNS